MAAEFIGYSILVTLRTPPGAQIEGVVSDVINQKLYLRNALLRWNGQRLPSYALDATAIADLEIAPSPSAHEDELPTPTAPPPQEAQPAAFVDPAILSYNRNGRPPQSQAAAQHAPVSPIMIADGAVPSPLRTGQQSLRGQSSISSIATARHTVRKTSRRDSSATATLTEPFDALAVKDDKENLAQAEMAEKKKSQTAPGIIDLKDVYQLPPKSNKKQPGKGRGWRNTPLIEEKPKSGRKPRGRQAAVEDQNGWATEDATDIADLGEFDFEGNHAKFDKRKVFDDIRRDDTTADEDRLVSFNRTKPRPGTNGGRNLHFTENVLDVPETPDMNRWKSEAGETEDEIIPEEHYSSGRNSRRAASRRPLQSRKSSVHPAHLDRKELSPRSSTRMPAGSPLNGSVSGIRASFRVASNNKPCHTVSPLQMLELEQLCTSELGLTDDMLTENAGRSITEAILKSSSLIAASTLNAAQAQPSEVKNVLFLLGNHKSSARALAAARQLRNRRLRVTVCLLGLERGEDQLLEIVRKQLKTYKLSLGHVERWDDYQAKLANGAAGTGAGGAAQASVLPPDFIVDSLLGVHHAFDELRTDDQATVFSMIKWANLSASKLAARASPASSVPILSIDVPSGLSATSGITAEADGQALVMSSTSIICLGAPKAGLLAFMAGDHHHVAIDTSAWAVGVADIGISLVAWQRNGSRRKQGIEFGKEWVLPLRLAQ